MTDPIYTPDVPDHRREPVRAGRFDEAGLEGDPGTGPDLRAPVAHGKDAAVETVASTSEVLDHAAADFSARGHEGFAQVAATLSGAMSDYADDLEHRSADDLIQEAGRLVSRYPLLFIAGAVTFGVALTRLVRASAHDDVAYGSAEWEDDSAYAGDEALPPDIRGPGSPGASYGNPELAALGMADRSAAPQGAPGTVEGPVRSEGAPATEGAPRP